MRTICFVACWALIGCFVPGEASDEHQGHRTDLIPGETRFAGPINAFVSLPFGIDVVRGQAADYYLTLHDPKGGQLLGGNGAEIQDRRVSVVVPVGTVSLLAEVRRIDGTQPVQRYNVRVADGAIETLVLGGRQ